MVDASKLDVSPLRSPRSHSPRAHSTSGSISGNPNKSSLLKTNSNIFTNREASTFDAGRHSIAARKQLRQQRNNNDTARRLKIEAMFSFLPTKLMEVIQKEAIDDFANPNIKGKSSPPLVPNSKFGSAKIIYKNQVVPRALKSEFNGVIVMADLVKSTNLSEEMVEMEERRKKGLDDEEVEFSYNESSNNEAATPKGDQTPTSGIDFGNNNEEVDEDGRCNRGPATLKNGAIYTG